MNYDFLIVYNHYVLQYILEPNNIIYFLYHDANNLYSTTSRLDASSFYLKQTAIREQERIKNKFGLEFQIVEV